MIATRTENYNNHLSNDDCTLPVVMPTSVTLTWEPSDSKKVMLPNKTFSFSTVAKSVTFSSTSMVYSTADSRAVNQSQKICHNSSVYNTRIL